MRILHIIAGLTRGGAEGQLMRLLTDSPQDAAVFSLTGPGSYTKEIESLGVRVFSGDASRPLSVRWFQRLHRAIVEYRPDLLCGWLYHGNLAASFAAPERLSLPIIWNIRHSLHALELEKRTTRWVIRLGALASAKPAHILYNSAAAAAQHEAIGYRATTRVVIPNGFDTARFKPDELLRNVVRCELGIGPDERVVGMVGRFNPIKNHSGFLEAIGQVVRETPPFKVVIAGRGVDEPSAGLVQRIERLGLASKVKLLPETAQPERLYPVFDFLVMPSWGESFPNVVGEAMASEVPCLVSDVGDAAAIVRDSGRVVRAPGKAALAEALVEMLHMPTESLRTLGSKARERVICCYSLPAVNHAYAQVFRETLHSGSRSRIRES